MKTALLFVISFFCVSTLSSQNIGINKTTPEHTLDVRSINNADAAGLNISNQDKSRNIRFFSGNSTYPDPSMSWAPSYSLLFATFDDNTLAFNEYMRISKLGNVGLGTSNPEARFEIHSKFSGDTLVLLKILLLEAR